MEVDSWEIDQSKFGGFSFATFHCLRGEKDRKGQSLCKTVA